MPSERTHYEERTPWPLWVRALFWIITVVVCGAMLVGVDTSLPFAARLALTALIAGGALGARALLGGLTVRIQGSRILIHLGSVPLIRRRVAFDEIRAVRSVAYKPMYEFGGWGVRGVHERAAWSARGNEAVVLDLTGDRVLYIGSDRPHRLEDRIRAAVGDSIKGATSGPALDAGKGSSGRGG